MKFEHTEVFNFEGAFRGARNPMNSHHKSDSFFGIIDDCDDRDYCIAEKYVMKDHPEYYDDSNDGIENSEDTRIELEDKYDEWIMNNGILNRNNDNGYYNVAYLGPNDLDLAQRLIKAGPEHRKFLRQIFVCVDITAPMYWWSEFDTYKIGTTANSTSKMHKLASTPITLECFEIDDYQEINMCNDFYCPQTIIDYCEKLRQTYLKTKDVRYWKELIRWLPESWLQTRTVTLNYENIRNIYFQRQNHKLNEWTGKHTKVEQSFCQWVESLPYAKELILYTDSPQDYFNPDNTQEQSTESTASKLGYNKST